jgi:hypothetical protein
MVLDYNLHIHQTKIQLKKYSYMQVACYLPRLFNVGCHRDIVGISRQPAFFIIFAIFPIFAIFIYTHISVLHIHT